jgi:hypothetical protein
MAEFKNLDVGSKEFDEVAKHITAHYPTACIMYIQKIVNPPYQKEYNDLKEKMIKNSINPGERILVHGSRETAIHSISQYGYDPSLSKVHAYGKGTYFTHDATYSSKYSDISKRISGFELSYLLVNSVLVGRMVNGKPASVIDLRSYDTQVDNVAKPYIYSVPRAEQAIPIYIIAYHRGAR